MARRLAKSVGITATGEFYPDRIVTNEDLAKMMDTSDEWITSRTGIKRRRWVEPGVASSDLGAKALQMALEQRGIAADELDAIVACTVTPDMFFPCTAALIQNKVGAKKAFGYDLNAGCSGFLFGLTTAASLVAGGGFKRVAVVGCEVMTSIMDKTDRNTVVLFGDGAGAAVVTGRDNPGRIRVLDAMLKADGSVGSLLTIHGGGSACKPVLGQTIGPEYFVQMNGRDVFKHAVRCMCEISGGLLERNDLTTADVDLIIPHQANIRIIEAIAKKLDVDMGRIYVNVDRIGNTSAASIPIALTEAVTTGRIEPGMTVLLTAFGGGFTWASALLQF